MKKSLIILSLLTVLCSSAQDIKLNLPDLTVKNVVITTGACITTYAVFKKGCSKQDTRLSLIGALFITLPYVLDKKSNIGINSTGINIKLKYKRFKCYNKPYKKKSYEKRKH